MSVLALAPGHFFVRSTDVALMYLLIAAAPPLIGLSCRLLPPVQTRVCCLIATAYAAILILISPEIVKLANHAAVPQWLFEGTVILAVSSWATIVFGRRRQRPIG